jgi:hypothetical protein
MIADTDRAEKRFELFRGLPEDRYVPACLDGAPYAQDIWQGPDRVEDTIEVLRTSSLALTKTGVSQPAGCYSANTATPAISRQ